MPSGLVRNSLQPACAVLLRFTRSVGTCQQAGIALAGGHSIDAPEPIFGLAVTGVVPTERVSGEHANAQRLGEEQLAARLRGAVALHALGRHHAGNGKSLLKPEHKGLATEVMCQMNLAGAAFANIDGVKASFGTS
jgi:selenide,water dikinase